MTQKLATRGGQYPITSEFTFDVANDTMKNVSGADDNFKAVGTHVFDAILLPHRGPAAVSRRIVAIHIDALDGHAARSGSHVVPEVSEVLPAVADRDSAPAIVRVRRLVRVLAAILHAAPDLVLGGAVAAMLE